MQRIVRISALLAALLLRNVPSVISLASVNKNPPLALDTAAGTVNGDEKTRRTNNAVLSSNQKALDENCPNFPRTWVPLASTLELNPDRPTPVQFWNQNYVVFQGDNGRWTVLDDACAHRLAPLSEGRMETSCGKRTVQCSYHGWTFDDQGVCQDIPQLTPSAKQRALGNPQCHVQSYSTIVENGILWAWLWKEDAVELTLQNPAIAPDQMMQGIAPVLSTYTRDLPYGWDTLLENLIDPSHVPFAHHNLQGTRDDAMPINMTIVDNHMDQSGFEVRFVDRTMGMLREGAASFRAPYTLIYTGEYFDSAMTGLSLQRYFNLTTISIPTRPGWSRVLILAAFAPPPQQQNGTLASADENGIKGQPRQPLWSRWTRRRRPTWYFHQLSNRFLDSDLAVLHYQEQERDKRGGDNNDDSFNSLYFMPAPADRAINAFRRWKHAYASVPGPLPPPLHNRKQLFDRQTQHTDQCRHCQAELASLPRKQARAVRILAASVVLVAVARQVVALALPAGIVAAGCLRYLHRLQAREKSLTVGDYRHYDNDGPPNKRAY